MARCVEHRRRSVEDAAVHPRTCMVAMSNSSMLRLLPQQMASVDRKLFWVLAAVMLWAADAQAPTGR
jgi:hypothetical protein